MFGRKRHGNMKKQVQTSQLIVNKEKKKRMKP